MKSLVSTTLLLLLCLSLSAQDLREEGNLILDNIPETPQKLKDRMQQYQNVRAAAFRDWLPDDQGVLIGTRFGSTSQLHMVNHPMGARQQLTFFEEPVRGGSFSPQDDENGLLFMKDAGGNEASQHFYMDLETRTTQLISDGESVNGRVLWSNDGDKFVFTSTRRNGKDYDLYLSHLSDLDKAELILESLGEGTLYASAWSPDDSKLLLGQAISSTHQKAYVLDLSSGALTPIGKEAQEAYVFPADWLDDNRNILIGTSVGSDFVKLAHYDLKTGETKIVHSDINWDISDFAMNHDRSLVVFVLNENGVSQPYKMKTSDLSIEPINFLPFAGQMRSLKFHPNRDELAFTFGTSNIPGDVFSYNFDKGKLQRWTDSEVGGLDVSTFPTPKLIEYPTFDKVGTEQRKIPAYIYKPFRKGPHPVIINIHGGPEAQAKPYFSSFNGLLANELGICVIVPNVRGSDGYGNEYLKLDNGYKREDSVKDIGALLDWIEQQEDLDASKVAVQGGSYGGYMVLASMIHYNDRIKCGIENVGISNFVTFLKNTKDYRRDRRRVEYGDERDPRMEAFLQKISPLTNADQITSPLFVIQGANDPRVPRSEAEQIVEAVRENGGDVWYLLAMDEGHGFRKKGNQMRSREAIVQFLTKFLLDE